MAKKKTSAEKLGDVSNQIAAVRDVFMDADKKGLGQGKPGTGEIACPICKRGKIRYNVASCNGHVAAACSTPKCLRFIQ
jgi:hypothetical protein